MFSGIVEEFATVRRLVREQGNLHLTMTCSFVNELKIDQSVSHNGVCLTVVDITGDEYTVTAMTETLERSNIGLLKVGDKVNVERSMMMNGRLDGHIVQGHVDETAECVSVRDADGSWYYTFRYKKDDEMAIPWLQKAVEQDHIEAKALYAACLINIDKFPEKAYNLMHEAATANFSEAQYAMGYFYDVGLLVRKNRDQAIVWYKKAAENGDEDAKAKLRELGALP